MPYQRVLEFAALSDAGRVRDHNEDALVVCPDYGCAVLADGMGGYRAGEVASAMTTQIIAEYLCKKFDSLLGMHFGKKTRHLSRWMTDSIIEANRQVLHISQTNADCFGMGTTVVTAACVQDRLLLAHVGDSRAYLFRNELLVRLTQDHSVIQEQISAGQITEEQAHYSSLKNLITKAVGTQSSIDVELQVYTLQEDDLYMLCSDGLTDMLSHDEIQTIIQRYKPDLEKCCQELVDRANYEGGTDNISVILFRTKVANSQPWIQRILSR